MATIINKGNPSPNMEISYFYKEREESFSF